MKKALAVGIIFLFIGVTNLPGNNTNMLIASEETNTICASSIPPDNGTLSGYVTDTSMNPIEGAKITVYFHNTSRENYSDSTGYYHVTDIPICWCIKNATCVKEGYYPEWVMLVINETTTHDFVLSPKGNWLYVGGSGPGNYTTIQSAINDANPGETVFVYGDSSPYYENVIIDKSIDLIGENSDDTIIDGDLQGIVLVVNANDVEINGFTIQNGYENTGGGGIDIHSSNNIIKNNLITSNVLTDGIRINYCSSGGNNTIIDNQIIANGGGGILLYNDCNFNKISRNIISNSGTFGLNIANSHDNIVSNNYFTLSGFSELRLENSYNNIITENNIDVNNSGLILAESSNNNFLFHNNIFGNHTQNSYDDGTNTWYNTSIHEGNYWSNYTGEDINNDGIGDTPYNISGGTNQDLYPLMHPFELYYVLNISLNNPEVDEGNTFKITIKTVGGTIVQDAQVFFNDEIKLTNSSGMVQFTAPQVTEDTIYPIIAVKSGYTPDNHTILVKNVPEELTRSFIFGRYANLMEEGGYITIEGVNLWLILFNPFEIYHFIIQYGGPETVTYLRDTAKVILLPQFILGFVEVVP